MTDARPTLSEARDVLRARFGFPEFRAGQERAVLAAAYFGVQVFNRAIADTQPPSWIDIRLYPPVLLFAIGTAVLATFASGLLPALQASRTDIGEISITGTGAHDVDELQRDELRTWD